ncbi:hypothetical protein BVRB_3g051670 [Beta vulgaris subsp. vulgaris]|nr:hypothetical protein BVRB_3g051670 [Beta vulgaris subsp. vulgaris]
MAIERDEDITPRSTVDNDMCTQCSNVGGLHRRRKINVIWKCECAEKPNINRNRRQNKDAHKAGLQVSDEVGAESIRVATSRRLRKSKKCECPAMMYASVNGDGEWVVWKTVLEHKNHNATPGEWKQASLHIQATLKPHLRRSSANEVDVGLLENDAMTAALRDVICDSFSGDEFERRWKIVIDQYGLVENAWLTRLYENRFMWVPIYNKDTFWA